MDYNPGKKSYTVVCWGRGFYHQRFREKIFFCPNQITHTPPSKVKWWPLNFPKQASS